VLTIRQKTLLAVVEQLLLSKKKLLKRRYLLNQLKKKKKVNLKMRLGNILPVILLFFASCSTPKESGAQVVGSIKTEE
jgi:hypothetical protein